MPKKYMSKEEVLETVRRKLGRGAGVKIAKIAKVSSAAVCNWTTKDNIPPDRVGLISTLTGIPEHEIRPDLFTPPVNIRG